MKAVFTTLACFVTLSAAPAMAQPESLSPRSIPTRLDCGALSSKPKKDGPFTARISLLVFQGMISAERPLASKPGSEKFTGTIDPLGRIELTGGYNDVLAWTYRFKGQLSDTKETVLSGALEVTSGTAGHRVCSMTLLGKPEDVMAAFSY